MHQNPAITFPARACVFAGFAKLFAENQKEAMTFPPPIPPQLTPSPPTLEIECVLEKVLLDILKKGGSIVRCCEI